MSGKRHFPYYSAVPEIELKRLALAGAAPGRERAEPRVFQEGPGFGAVPEEVCSSQVHMLSDVCVCTVSRVSNHWSCPGQGLQLSTASAASPGAPIGTILSLYMSTCM